MYKTYSSRFLRNAYVFVILTVFVLSVSHASPMVELQFEDNNAIISCVSFDGQAPTECMIKVESEVDVEHERASFGEILLITWFVLGLAGIALWSASQ